MPGRRREGGREGVDARQEERGMGFRIGEECCVKYLV